jgi:hypothetical protein
MVMMSGHSGERLRRFYMVEAFILSGHFLLLEIMS